MTKLREEPRLQSTTLSLSQQTAFVLSFSVSMCLFAWGHIWPSLNVRISARSHVQLRTVDPFPPCSCPPPLRRCRLFSTCLKVEGWDCDRSIDLQKVSTTAAAHVFFFFFMLFRAMRDDSPTSLCRSFSFFLCLAR